MKYFLSILAMLVLRCSDTSGNEDLKRMEEQAQRVTITRDKWGVAHVHGKTDADAVFGVMYAQCEENFEKVESNYIEKMGRMAEAKGEAYLYNDLLMQLLYDTITAKADYTRSPAWLKNMLHAFADGINFYLARHPEVRPALLKKFEPWYPLLFTDGGYTALQTGGLQMQDVKLMYPIGDQNSSSMPEPGLFPKEPIGSNAFAIGPSRTVNGKALLYINPHVSFYFRTEMHMSSDEGLNAYGAITWGQFFVYQGFNENCGWMHTSSQADATDLYSEKIIRKGDSVFYQYESELRTLKQKKIDLVYKNDNNKNGSHPVIAYQTHHGPVVGARSGNWLSLKSTLHSLNGLIQSWQRTKARDLASFKSALELRTNISTNTMYADKQGNIAYWHGNLVPKRNASYDWEQPVDGSIAATEWMGIHDIDELVTTINPAQGWLQNCNSSPYHVAGPNSIDKKKYAFYMAPDGENFRSLFANRELQRENKFTISGLIALGYDHYLSAFDTLLPSLFRGFDQLTSTNPQRLLLKEAIDTLRNWDKRSAITSVATTIAIEWSYQLINFNYNEAKSVDDVDQVKLFASFAVNIPVAKQLELLEQVVSGLQKAYGRWKIPWGDINRYQRVDDGEDFDDARPSLPVGMASSVFGSLPSYETVWHKNGKGYGIAGNSFVAAVEFGERVVAKSITTGGQFFDPSSKHYDDQAAGYITGEFKDVLFYRDDILKHAERTYHPGSE